MASRRGRWIQNGRLTRLAGVPFRVRRLERRAEVVHAHCRHDLARRLFPDAYAKSLSIAEGLQATAEFVRRQPIPQPTECPCPIEIADRLPPAWAQRLGDPPSDAFHA